MRHVPRRRCRPGTSATTTTASSASPSIAPMRGSRHRSGSQGSSLRGSLMRSTPRTAATSSRRGRGFPPRTPNAASVAHASRSRTRTRAAAPRSARRRGYGTTGSCMPCAMNTGCAMAPATQDRRGPVRGRQIGRQRDQPGERRGAAQARRQRDRAALREAGEQDARCRDAARDLALDQRPDLRDRLRDAGFVGAVGKIEVGDVVPRPHARTVVDRDRAHRRVRKHEAQRGPVAAHQFRHDRREVVAVGAEAVQPDHGSSAATAAVSCSTVSSMRGSGRVNGRDCARAMAASVRFPSPLRERDSARSAQGEGPAVRDDVKSRPFSPLRCAKRPSPQGRGGADSLKMRLRFLRQRRVRLRTQFARAHQHLRRRRVPRESQKMRRRRSHSPGAPRRGQRHDRDRQHQPQDHRRHPRRQRRRDQVRHRRRPRRRPGSARHSCAAGRTAAGCRRRGAALPSPSPCRPALRPRRATARTS